MADLLSAGERLNTVHSNCLITLLIFSVEFTKKNESTIKVMKIFLFFSLWPSYGWFCCKIKRIIFHFCGAHITLLVLFLTEITRYLCDSWFALAVRCIFFYTARFHLPLTAWELGCSQKGCLLIMILSGPSLCIAHLSSHVVDLNSQYYRPPTAALHLARASLYFCSVSPVTLYLVIGKGEFLQLDFTRHFHFITIKVILVKLLTWQLSCL